MSRPSWTMKNKKLIHLATTLCASGVILYGINYLAAAFAIKKVTSWPTGEPRIVAAFSDYVGREPTVMGAVLFVSGLILSVIAVKAGKDAE